MYWISIASVQILPANSCLLRSCCKEIFSDSFAPLVIFASQFVQPDLCFDEVLSDDLKLVSMLVTWYECIVVSNRTGVEMPIRYS